MPLITVAHSPDSDDAFMHYALARHKIETGDIEFQHVLQDIETLNQRAEQGLYEVTAISIHAYAHLAERYALLPHGASMGERYGPMIVARGEVMAGLLIHEGQLTYGDEGLHNIIDLGAWWADETGGLPLPLGGNAIRRDLGPELTMRVSHLLRESIRYALEHRDEALDYALEFARDLDARRNLADQFVGMYVNSRTLDYGEDGRRAVQLFLDKGFEAGVIPHRVPVVFAG